MARRRRLRLDSTADSTATLLPGGEGIDGAGLQLVNAGFIAAGAFAVAYSQSDGGLFDSMRVALYWGGGALLLTTALDVLGDYVGRARDWRDLHITIIMPGAVKPVPTAAQNVQSVAEPTETEPAAPVESAAIRDARRDMIMLLQRAIELKGFTGRQVPSDDDLGQQWGPTRRSRVVSYFGDDLEIKRTGAHRGTFVAKGYNLGELLADVKAKSLPPLLPEDAI